jgi:hypothetical protein
MSDGQVRLGPSKFPKVAYKTPVTLDSSDEDWVWCGDSKENVSQGETPAAGPQAEKGLSPVGSEDARSLSEEAIGFEGARVVKAMHRPDKKVTREMIHGRPGTINSGFQGTGCPLGPENCVSLLPDNSGGELFRQADFSPVKWTTGGKGTPSCHNNEGPVARDLLSHATGCKLDPGTVILTQPGVLDHRAKRTGCEQDDRATTGSCAMANEPGPCSAQPDRFTGQNSNDPVYIHESPVMVKDHPVSGISGRGGISNDDTGFGTPCGSPKGNLRDFGSDRVAMHFPKTPQKMPTPPKEVTNGPVCRRLLENVQEMLIDPEPGVIHAGGDSQRHEVTEMEIDPHGSEEGNSASEACDVIRALAAHWPREHGDSPRFGVTCSNEHISLCNKFVDPVSLERPVREKANFFEVFHRDSS